MFFERVDTKEQNKMIHLPLFKDTTDIFCIS